MAVLDNKRTLPAPMGNVAEYIRVVWDFSVDGGAVADFDVFEADSAMIVKLAAAIVKTAATSTDAMVVDLGKSAGGTDFWSDKAVAALTLNSVHTADTKETGVYLADGDKIVMGIEAFAATAGKIEFIFELMKF